MKKKPKTFPELFQFTQMNNQPTAEEISGYHISKVHRLHKTIRYLTISKITELKLKLFFILDLYKLKEK